MTNIEKLIENTKLALAEMLDRVLYEPVKDDLIRLNLRSDDHSLIECSEVFKADMRTALDELKVELVRGELEKEAPTTNKYKVVPVALLDDIIELQEGDIPVYYRSHTSNISGMHHVIVVVLRPVAEGK